MAGSTRTPTTPLFATIALIGVTAVWGSTFFLLKDLVREMPPIDFLGLRFSLAALVVVTFQFRRLRAASKRAWKHGLMLGAVYSAAQLMQTVGLQTTNASVSGFITGMYVVFTPILVAILFRQRIKARVWIAVAIATIGLALLSLQGLAFGPGESITLFGALLYAVHIVLLARWSKLSDPLTLGMIQIISAGVICLVAALPGGISLPQSPATWASFIYMTLVAGLAAIVVQSWAQSRITATTAAVVMTTEPVFAAGFAIAFGGEHITLRLIIGGVLVLLAMMLVETKSSNEQTIE